jgi:hypothetical protein
MEKSFTARSGYVVLLLEILILGMAIVSLGDPDFTALSDAWSRALREGFAALP